MAVSSLPGEILLEILSRLPKKSLRRSEIVSKEWEKLIKEAPSLPAKSTDFGFVVFKNLIDRFIERAIFYRLDDRGALVVEDSIPFTSPFFSWIMGSWNGVVFYSKENRVNKVFSYHLYNPFTKHHTNLPRLPPFRMDYDPKPCALGVVPLPETNHFRFIVAYIRPSRGINRTHSRGLKIATFDSFTREWMTRPAKFSDESYEELADLCSSGFELGASDLCFKLSLYWVRRSYLIVFCLKTETFRLLHVPPNTRSKHRGLLWESEGRLNYSQICLIDGLCIWVFKEAAKFGENWKIIVNISQLRLRSLLAEIIGSCLLKPPPLTRVSAFNEHLQMFHLQTEEGLSVSYHIPNKRMTLVSLSGLDGYADLLLPFAFRKHDLPDLEGTDPASATGRKRTLSPTTLRRSIRNKRKCL